MVVSVSRFFSESGKTKMRAQWFARRQVKERTKLGLQRARANGRIGGGRYKLSATQQAEAIKMIRLGEKSQAEIAELFNVDRSTISRMMKEVREKELLKAAR